VYAVTTRIEFCYGHRLLEHQGLCRHLHGHNAVAEIEIRAAALDAGGMVIDFNDIKTRLTAWIDRELDHRMILRADDPLVGALRQLGEPVYVVGSDPTAECVARLLFDVAREQGLPVRRVTVWETSSSSASYTDDPS
jgi:6-pyruvoyltetrahydropterin/6-carboxytetrahydropterin synthase